MKKHKYKIIFSKICVIVLALSIIVLYFVVLNNGNKQGEYLNNNMYEILGMLDEYISRFDYFTNKPIPELVECFYPHERELSEYFQYLIKSYRLEAKISFKYVTKIEQEGHIFIYSNDLSKIINSFYTKRGFLSKSIFNEADKTNMLFFIKGAYKRYGWDQMNVIGMANAPEKIRLIAYVLKNIGCSNVKTYCDDAIPTSYIVVFEPSDYIKEHIEITKSLMDSQFEKEWFLKYAKPY